ncbi:MAG: CGGC domain-containing protein [Planctomycetota bacterium]|nr:CGGC domain-containing protein [Planctomycetota bacterium]
MEKSYVVVVQCAKATDAVCPGFLCEHAFNARIDAFAGYPAERPMRYNAISCGGCPGRAVLRKLVNLKKNLKKRENIEAGSIVAHLSTCIAKPSHHGPRCPHADYIKAQIGRAGLPAVEGTRFSPRAEARRRDGIYP